MRVNDSGAARVIRARSHLLLAHPWFGIPCYKALNPVETPGLEHTFETDGTRLYFDPERVKQCTDAELQGLLAKQTLACVLQHPYRLEGKDEDLINRASDLVVNPMLLDDGLQLPAGETRDQSYKGLAVETVYAKLKAGRQKQTKQPPPAMAGMPGQPNGGSGGSQQDGQGSGQSQQPDGQQGQQGEQDASENGPPSPNKGPQSASGSSSEQDSAQGQDQRQHQSQTRLRPAPEPAAGDEKATDARTGQPDNTAREWEINGALASAIAKKAGKLPGDADRAAAASRREVADWRAILRPWMQQLAPSNYSWTRPNRKLLAQGYYLPGVVKDQIPYGVFALDTSGSIDAQVLSEFSAEFGGAMDEANPEYLDLVSCDTKIQSVERFYPGDPLELHPKGGGGTVFKPVFDWIAEQDKPPAFLVFMTDLENYDGRYGTAALEEPDYPVLWVCGEDITRQAPFGEVLKLPI